jgi:hypothetical protein
MNMTKNNATPMPIVACTPTLSTTFTVGEKALSWFDVEEVVRALLGVCAGDISCVFAWVWGCMGGEESL